MRFGLMSPPYWKVADYGLPGPDLKISASDAICLNFFWRAEPNCLVTGDYMVDGSLEVDYIFKNYFIFETK